MKKSKHHKDCLVHTQTFLGRGLYLGFDKYHACPCKDLNAAKKLLKRYVAEHGELPGVDE